MIVEDVYFTYHRSVVTDILVSYEQGGQSILRVIVKAVHNVVQIHFVVIVGLNLLAILGLLSGLYWWPLWRLGLLGGLLEYLR